MKIWPLLLVLLAGCSGCATVSPHADLRATTLRLGFGATALCSGTAIGPSVLITAQHCLGAGMLRTVNGQAVTVVGIGKDKRDTLTIRITGMVFKHWAHMGPPLHQGSRVRWVGNPAGEPDIYREGYVVRANTDEVLIDAHAFGGDSGSGIFDDEGRLIGVLTGAKWWRSQDGLTFSLVVMYPIEIA